MCHQPQALEELSERLERSGLSYEAGSVRPQIIPTGLVANWLRDPLKKSDLKEAWLRAMGEDFEHSCCYGTRPV